MRRRKRSLQSRFCGFQPHAGHLDQRLHRDLRHAIHAMRSRWGQLAKCPQRHRVATTLRRQQPPKFRRQLPCSSDHFQRNMETPDLWTILYRRPPRRQSLVLPIEIRQHDIQQLHRLEPLHQQSRCRLRVFHIREYGDVYQHLFSIRFALVFMELWRRLHCNRSEPCSQLSSQWDLYRSANCYQLYFLGHHHTIHPYRNKQHKGKRDLEAPLVSQPIFRST